MNITDQLAQALERLIAVCNYEDIRPHVAGHITLGKEALEAYRASKEGEKVEYRMLRYYLDKFEDGDEWFSREHKWEPVHEVNLGLTYTEGYLPHRRPILAT